MSEEAERRVPVLWPAWASPRSVALFGVVLFLVDMVLDPRLTLAGRGVPWGPLISPEGLLAIGATVLPASALALASVARTLRAKTAAGAVVGSFASGLVFSASTLAGTVLVLHLNRPEAGPVPLELLATLVPVQALAFGFSLLGLALPISKSLRTRSCDAFHGALIVTGAWLLVAGTFVRWGALGGQFAAHFVWDPRAWSLPLALAGFVLAAAGVVADVRLVGWLASVKRGEVPTFRIEPPAGRTVEIPSVVLDDTAQTDGLLVALRGEKAIPTAWVFLDGSDDRRLLVARFFGALGAAAFLMAVVLVAVPVMLLLTP